MLVGKEVGIEGEQDVGDVVAVDDAGVFREQIVAEKEGGAEAVDVANKELVDGLVEGECDAVLHAFGGAIGEGEAEHVVEADAAFVGLDNAFGKDVGFATAWGG